MSKSLECETAAREEVSKRESNEIKKSELFETSHVTIFLMALILGLYSLCFSLTLWHYM